METVLEARSLAKDLGFKNNLKSINLEILNESFVTIFGNQNSGKSELLALLANTTPSTKGELFVLGLNSKNNYISIKKKTGYVPQYVLLDEEFTVLDNLLIISSFYGIKRKEALLRAREVLRFVGLDDSEGLFINALSFFQKRCLTLAKALINKPEVLFLDDPLLGLKGVEKEKMLKIIKKQKDKKRTIVCTTQTSLELCELSDQIIFLHNGKKISDGHPDELMEEFIGKEVVEFDVNILDRNYYVDRVKDDYDYILSENRVFVFIKKNQDSKVAIKKINSDYIQSRKATISDMYLKISGSRLF